jgi:DNA-binding IclR family transcriptional regulator
MIGCMVDNRRNRVHIVNMGSDVTTFTKGAQVVKRVSSVLRALASAPPDGLSTSAVAASAGLTRPTAHRLLSALLDEGLTDRDNRNGRWFLGPDTYIMGMLAAPRFDVSDQAADCVRQLAADTGESAFFSVRRHRETVCLLHAEGSFPVRSFVLREGTRFPLGVASAGLAILSHLPDQDIDRYLSESPLEQEYGLAHSREAILARVRETRERGYAVNPGLIVEGDWGLGAAVFDTAGQPRWALSLTGIEPRFRPGRQRELGRALLDAAYKLTKGTRRTDRP